MGQVVTKGQKESCSLSVIASKAVVSDEAKSVQSKVFLRLTGHYGRLFTKRFEGKEGKDILKMAVHEWAVQLSKYSEAQVMEALTVWIGRDEYPPVASNIVDIIKSRQPTVFFKRLPKPKADDETIKKWAKQWKQDLTK